MVAASQNGALTSRTPAVRRGLQPPSPWRAACAVTLRQPAQHAARHAGHV